MSDTYAQYAKYITSKTKQEVEGCVGLVVVTEHQQCPLLIQQLEENGWTLKHPQHTMLNKEGHSSLYIISGANGSDVWPKMCAMHLNHAFVIEGSYEVALRVGSKLRSRVGVVDKGIHVLFEQMPVMLKIEGGVYE